MMCCVMFRRVDFTRNFALALILHLQGGLLQSGFMPEEQPFEAQRPAHVTETLIQVPRHIG